MNTEKEAGSAETPAKSPDTNKPFQERFNEQLEAWRKEGCPIDVTPDLREKQGKPKVLCGARPHRARMLPAVDGVITMSVDCVNGHVDVWQFKVSSAEMEKDIAAQSAAATRASEDAAGVARDPLKAVLKITMDLRTQAVDIEPWVPTPGVGIQLAGILMSHFFAEIQAGQAAANERNGIALPPEKKLLDRNGKPIVFN